MGAVAPQENKRVQNSRNIIPLRNWSVYNTLLPAT